MTDWEEPPDKLCNKCGEEWSWCLVYPCKTCGNQFCEDCEWQVKRNQWILKNIHGKHFMVCPLCGGDAYENNIDLSFVGGPENP